MSSSNIAELQEIFVTYEDGEVAPKTETQSLSRSFLSGDARIFEEFPECCFIIRDWKPGDAVSPFEEANLHDMWGIVIVFRNGLHEHYWMPVPLHGCKPVYMPYRNALAIAEDMLKEEPSLREIAALRQACVSEPALVYGSKKDPARIESRRRSRRLA